MNKLKILNKGTVKSKELGITLIALVVTIVVLLILAGVSIQMLTGDNGILTRAIQAKDNTEVAQIIEEAKMDILAIQSLKIGDSLTEEELEGILSPKYGTLSTEESRTKNKKLTTTDGRYVIPVSEIYNGTLTIPLISSTESYVGYYADIDDDGTVDGIIFADLAKEPTNENKKWTNNDGAYDWTVKTNLDSYYVKRKNYNGNDSNGKGFGTADVIAPINKDDTNDRFYVMQIENFKTAAYTDPNNSDNNYPAYTSYYWYKNAQGKMSPLITSNNFGEGKENSRKMIAKWNAGGTDDGYYITKKQTVNEVETDVKVYATKEKQDIWKHIQTAYTNGWFLPSKAEWAAFAGELGVNKTANDPKNYANLGLSDRYWSSSQNYTSNSWGAIFDHGGMDHYNVGSSYSVRLATTF